MAVKRPTLRKLARAAGILPNDAKTFQLKPEELLEELAPHFDGIEDMSQEEVEELIAEVEASGAGEEQKEEPKTTTRRRTTRKKAAPKEEAKEEPEKKTTTRRRTTRKKATEKAEEPEKKTTTRRRTTRKKAAEAEAEAEKKTTTRRRTSTRKKEEPKEAAAKADVPDLGGIVDRLDTIGGEVDGIAKSLTGTASKKQVEDLDSRVGEVEEALEDLHAKLDGVAAALTDIFNSTFGDDEPIESVYDLVESE